MRFRVGAAGAALGLPAGELIDSSPALEDVWGAAGREIAERVGEAGTPAAQLHALAAAVRERLAAPPDEIVRAAATGTAREDLGIGDRQLRRRFGDAVGYGPKTLERILRFQRFLALARADEIVAARNEAAAARGADARHDLAGLALDAGYADQAHLTRECSRLAGLPPGGAARHRRLAGGRQVRFVQDGAPAVGHHGRMTVDLNAAKTFLQANARVLERRRFDHLLEGGPAEPVVDALRAYRNPDGGFGHAIEPDMRAPSSQPVGIHTALEILHEVGVRDDPMIEAAADWLATITRDDGGIPFVLEDAMEYPHAPWWQFEDASSPIQTPVNAAALHNLGAQHPWLDAASEYCFRQIAQLDLSAADQRTRLRAAVRRRVPQRHAGRRPCERGARRARPRPGAAGRPPSPTRAPRPRARSTSPPTPAAAAAACSTTPRSSATWTPSRRAQQDDGGWRVTWPDWNPAAAIEWRGVATINALRVLRANGRV